MKHRVGLCGAKRKLGQWATCPLCGRSGLHRATATASATFAFHYATCGRPCAGGVTLRLTDEDTPRGIHKGRDCAECQMAVTL